MAKPDLGELLKLVKAQAAARDRMQGTAAAGAVRAFKKLDRDDWWNPAKTKGATREALKVVQPAQRLAARNTSAFVARAAGSMTGRTVRPEGAVDVTKLRKAMPAQVREALANGSAETSFVILGDTEDGPGPDIDRPVTMVVPDPNESVIDRLRRRRAEQTAAEPLDPGDPYGRAADTFRREVAVEGRTEDQARRKALLRIQVAAETDVTLAVRQQHLAGLVNLADVRGYRRILHPELTKEGPCGLCVVAAGRLYRIAELLPMHARCACEVLPVIGEMDPGVSLNRDDLAALYQAAGGTDAAALRRLRVALTEHGELGPVLVDADQHWRSPAQVARAELQHDT